MEEIWSVVQSRTFPNMETVVFKGSFDEAFLEFQNIQSKMETHTNTSVPLCSYSIKFVELRHTEHDTVDEECVEGLGYHS